MFIVEFGGKLGRVNWGCLWFVMVELIVVIIIIVLLNFGRRGKMNYSLIFF